MTGRNPGEVVQGVDTVHLNVSITLIDAFAGSVTLSALGIQVVDY